MPIKVLGNAQNITVDFEASVMNPVLGMFAPFCPGALYTDGGGLVQSYALSDGLEVGETLMVHFAVILKYSRFSFKPCETLTRDQIWDRGGPTICHPGMVSETLIMNAADWDLTRTEDGIIIDNPRPAEDEYDSDMFNLEFFAGQANSTAAKKARVTAQVKITPSNGQSGYFTLSVPVIGGFGYNTPVETTTSRAISRQVALEFVPPKPKGKTTAKVDPVVLPADMMVTKIGPYGLNQKDLRGELTDAVNAWVNTLKTRKDCVELYRAITRPKKEQTPIVKLIGATDGLGNADINDPLGEARALGVKKQILMKLGQGDGGAEKSISWVSVGKDRNYPKLGVSLTLPKVSNKDERFVLIYIDKAVAEKVIGEMRGTTASIPKVVDPSVAVRRPLAPASKLVASKGSSVA